MVCFRILGKLKTLLFYFLKPYTIPLILGQVGLQLLYSKLCFLVALGLLVQQVPAIMETVNLKLNYLNTEYEKP